MKLMKCPECDEISTFSHSWTESIPYSAPCVVDDDGDVHIDFDNVYEGESEIDECDTECLCDKCNAQVSIDDIEIVEAANAVPAE